VRGLGASVEASQAVYVWDYMQHPRLRRRTSIASFSPEPVDITAFLTCTGKAFNPVGMGGYSGEATKAIDIDRGVSTITLIEAWLRALSARQMGALREKPQRIDAPIQHNA